jgi:hypothetical protein
MWPRGPGLGGRRGPIGDTARLPEPSEGADGDEVLLSDGKKAELLLLGMLNLDWLTDLRWAFSDILSTRVPWAFFSVFFTKPIMIELHLKSTSSLRYNPDMGAFNPNSTTSGGSPGKEPPTDQRSRISSPMAAKQCVWRPSGRSLKAQVYETLPETPGR